MDYQRGLGKIAQEKQMLTERIMRNFPHDPDHPGTYIVHVYIYIRTELIGYIIVQCIKDNARQLHTPKAASDFQGKN